ncbi:variable surface lipoprotein [Mycoplasmopsis hyopharyngis]|uniref:variable surface lipoprotein n=1 Tax=Mycoplasmopsis hyopharyngis TaxID=29558 RepID=UPI00387343BC
MKLNKKLLGFAAISLPFAFAPIALSASCNKEDKLELTIAEEKSDLELEQGIEKFHQQDDLKLTNISKAKLTVLSKDVLNKIAKEEKNGKTYYSMAYSFKTGKFHGIKDGEPTKANFEGEELFAIEGLDTTVTACAPTKNPIYKRKSDNKAMITAFINCQVEGKTITFKFRLHNYSANKAISSQVYQAKITLK